jgi:hypothetical protein
MKKVILLIAAVAVSTAMTFAQGNDKRVSNSNAADPTSVAPQQVQHTLHYTYANGKLMACKGDKAEMQTTDVTMQNNIQVSKTGMVTLKDGRKVQMKDGECVDVNGKIINHDLAHKTDKKAGHDHHDHSGHDHGDHSKDKK